METFISEVMFCQYQVMCCVECISDQLVKGKEAKNEWLFQYLDPSHTKDKANRENFV